MCIGKGTVKIVKKKNTSLREQWGKLKTLS